MFLIDAIDAADTFEGSIFETIFRFVLKNGRIISKCTAVSYKYIVQRFQFSEVELFFSFFSKVHVWPIHDMTLLYIK